MIQILTVRDPNQRELFCQKAELIDNDNLHIIAIHDERGMVCEGAIFKYQGESGEILWLDMGSDIELADGLGRAILSIMEIRGVKRVTMPSEYELLAEKMRFKRIEDHYEVTLEGYFCCGCQHK